MAQADVTIRVEAQTDDASAKIKKVSKDITDAAASSSKISEASTNGGTTPSTPLASQARKQDDLSAIGKKIGTAAVGYMTHQGLSAVTTYIGSREGGSATASRVSTIGGGAVQGGVAGAMVGGPIGAAVGAAAGALIGVFSSLSEEAKNLRNAIKAANLEESSYLSNRSATRQDRSFQKILEHSNRPQQLRLINEKYNNLEKGSGENSIVKLQARRLALEKSQKTDTQEYENVRQNLSIQRSRRSALDRMRDDLNLNQPLGEFIRANQVGDKLSVMGGSIGANVAIDDINAKQLSIQEQILQCIRGDASRDPSKGYIANNGTAIIG
ncbi:MAG: hypothetical protein RR996_01815 [Alistipes sp.]